MKNENGYELVVSQGKRAIWERALAAVFFTGMIYLLYVDAKMLYYAGINFDTCSLIAESLGSITFCFAGGIAFSMVKAVMIDTDADKLISLYSVGPFSKKIYTKVPVLDYVAVFKNAKDQFEVNLWYKGNKHYKMYLFETGQPAMIFATQVAKKLKIDLLDATVKNDSKWIDISES